jgi:predicted RNase H-like HicB family nuclease
MKFTAIIEQGENGWFVGQVKEVPAAISQGKTIKELKKNLTDALKIVLEANQESYICI